MTNVLAPGRWVTAEQGTACQGEPNVRKTSPEAATVAAKALQEPRTKVQIGALASLHGASLSSSDWFVATEMYTGNLKALCVPWRNEEGW